MFCSPDCYKFREPFSKLEPTHLLGNSGESISEQVRRRKSHDFHRLQQHWHENSLCVSLIIVCIAALFAVEMRNDSLITKETFITKHCLLAFIP